MAGSRKVYAPEFKLQAVQMIADQKLSVAEVARRLGVTENRLHDGTEAVLKKGAEAFLGSGHLTPVEDEPRRLRADLNRLEVERACTGTWGTTRLTGPTRGGTCSTSSRPGSGPWSGGIGVAVGGISAYLGRAASATRDRKSVV